MTILDQLKTHLNSQEGHYQTLLDLGKLTPHDRGQWDMVRGIKSEIARIGALPAHNIKYVLQPDQEQLLIDYTDFLLKNGYVDTDVYAEHPTAIDQFKQKKRKG